MFSKHQIRYNHNSHTTGQFQSLRNISKVCTMVERRDSPHGMCKCSIEALLADRCETLVWDDCPACAKLGVLCFVGNHPHKPLMEVFARMYSKVKCLEESAKREFAESRSEWVKSLLKSRKLTTNEKLMSHLPSFVSQDYPLPPAQYYQLTQLKDAPSDGSEGTKSMFRKLIGRWDLPYYDHDFNPDNLQHLGKERPSFVTRIKRKHGEQSIVTVNTVTSMPESNNFCESFTNEQIGHQLYLLYTALILQPWRSEIHGFLTDTRRFQFLTAKRSSASNASISFVRSGLYPDEVGWIAARLLLTQTCDRLGFQDISVPGWTLGECLGTHNYSTVFAMTRRDGDKDITVAAKLYDWAREFGGRDREASALMLLHDVPGVPRLDRGCHRMTAGGTGVLLTTPIGVPVSDLVRLPISAYASLVHTLKAAHQRNLYHNDVAPDCIRAVLTECKKYELMLCDWNRSEEKQGYCEIDRGDSCRRFYDPYLPFGASQDLCALVRSVFFLTQATFNHAEVTTSYQLDYMKKQGQLWSLALDLARYQQYDALAGLLKCKSTVEDF